MNCAQNWLYSLNIRTIRETCLFESADILTRPHLSAETRLSVPRIFELLKTLVADDIRLTYAIQTQYILNTHSIYALFIRCYPLLSATDCFDSGLGQCVKRIYSVPITSTSRTKIMCSECIQLLRLICEQFANVSSIHALYIRDCSLNIRNVRFLFANERPTFV